jgi:hypothetical protein
MEIFISKNGKKINFFISIFVTNFKIVFLIFSISYGHFFQNSKTKKINSNFKNDFFSKCFISNFPCDINKIFS